MPDFVANVGERIVGEVKGRSIDAATGRGVGVRVGPNGPPPPPPPGDPLAFVMTRTGVNTCRIVFARPVVYTGVLPLWIKPQGPSPRHVNVVTPVDSTTFDITWSNSINDGDFITFTYPDPSFVAEDGGPVVGDRLEIQPMA